MNWDPYFRDDPVHHATSPLSDLHVNLLHETRDEYTRLKRVQFRLLLGGEEALLVPNPEAPITEPEEFQGLLLKAADRGLIETDPTTLQTVEVTDDDFTLAISLMKKQVKVGDSFWEAVKSIPFEERFRDALLKASVHKLGAMLALTDQLTFDAQALGVPIPASYKPSEEIEKWEANWQRLFGEPMPTIEGLYRQAHSVFVEHSDPKDPLVAHLFALDTLPQLAA